MVELLGNSLLQPNGGLPYCCHAGGLNGEAVSVATESGRVGHIKSSLRSVAT